MFMNPISFAVIIALSLLGLWMFVEIGSLPGKKATEFNHPQAAAINILGWLGLLMGGAGWLVAMVWAYMKPVFPPAAVETPVPAAPDAGEAPSEEGS